MQQALSNQIYCVWRRLLSTGKEYIHSQCIVLERGTGVTHAAQENTIQRVKVEAFLVSTVALKTIQLFLLAILLSNGNNSLHSKSAHTAVSEQG